jgi:subfamily B ATP-binding cassette protein MsbA
MAMRWHFRSVGSVLGESLEGQNVSGLTRILLELARPYHRLLVPVLMLQLLAAALEAVGASLVVPLLQILINGTANATSLFVGTIGEWSSWVLGDGSFQSQLRRVAIAFLAVGLSRTMVQYASSVVSNLFSLKVSADLRRRLLALYLDAEYQFFLDRRQGRMLNDLTQEPTTAAFAITLFLDWGRQLFMVATLTLVLLSISWQATLVAVTVGVTVAITMERLRLVAAVISKEGLINKRRLSALIAEVLSGIRQIKLFEAENRVADSHNALVQESVRLGRRTFRLQLLPNAVSGMAAGVIVGGALLGLTFLPQETARTFLPVLGAFLVVSARLLPVVSHLSTQRVRLFSHVATLEFIQSSLKHVPQGQPPRTSEGSRNFSGLRTCIEFNHVTFAYKRSSVADTMPTRDGWLTNRFDPVFEVNDGPSPPVVLKDVNIVFKRGWRTALVGPSGAGKSTIVDLFVRLFDPQEGEILVDGSDIREYDVRSWRASIGYVSQDTFIFHGTIRENIAFAKPDATMEQVERAARIANAHEFILDFPEAYDTVVGDRGLKLSGGQRQRIAIARAIMRDPPILIFDEATSSLDTVAERAVQAGIDGASRNRTVIVVAHRLSTVMGADWIYVLDQGRVIESGQHADLVAQGGLYLRLYAAMVPVEGFPSPVGLAQAESLPRDALDGR